MPHYRLVADHGHSVAEFVAADDEAAETHARGLSSTIATVKTVGFRLEKQLADDWSDLASWLPRRIHDTPGGRDILVQPHSKPPLRRD